MKSSGRDVGLREKVRTSCSLNCWDNCGFEVTVENGQIINIEGDSGHPITKGKICGRGLLLKDRTYSDERILYPLKKMNGEFKRISWNQALDEIAEKMNEIKNTIGPLGILHSHDYGNGGLLKNLDKRFFNCFGGVTEVVGSLCWGAGIESQLIDFGNAYSHGPDDVLNSHYAVIWGRNISTTNMHLFNKIKEAKQNGTKVIVINPLFNATAKIADYFVSVKPGMDGMLALGVMKEILNRGLEDRTFINDHSIGFENVSELLSRLSFEDIVAYTEVSKNDIELLAQAYSRGLTMTYIGLGMQRYKNGGNTIRAIDALIAMSGNIGISGGGANYAKLEVGQSFDMPALTLPERAENIRHFTRMEQAKQILTAAEPPIKMLFVTRSNPLTQVPDHKTVKKAFQSVETKVVIDQFMTDTAQIADYILPCSTVFEEEDIYYSSMYHHYVNYGPKIIDALGEARSDCWIWTELAERLGFGADFDYTIEQFLEMGIGDLRKKGFNLEFLKKEGTLPLPVEEIPWANRQFETPSGKFEFVSERAKTLGLAESVQLAFPQESKYVNKSLADKFPYTLITVHPQRSNHSQYYPFIEVLQEIKVEISKDIAEERDLKNGDMVNVFNERGQLKGKVKIAERFHPKTIKLEEGQWAQYGGTANILTSNDVSDNKLGSVLYDCLVNVEKLF